MTDSVYTRQQFWGTFEPKEAEVGDMMPLTARPNTPDKGKKYVIPKTGSVSGDGLQQAVKGEQPAQNPQAQPIKPHVDVTSKEPPKLIKEKTAQHYAMPSIQRYPLDSYGDVLKAASYFDTYREQFTPAHRREYCSNLVKRASVLGINVSDDVRAYGSSRYASFEEQKVALDLRKLILDEENKAVLNKLAEAKVRLSPDDFAVVLGEFDKLAGIDHLYDECIPDPYLSTFGVKKAESEEDASYIIGNDYTNNNELKRLAASPCQDIEDVFGKEFKQEFKKDPIGIFKSLPVDQKKVVARMANEPVVNSG